MSEIFDRICRKIAHQESYLSYGVLKLLRRKQFGRDGAKLAGYNKFKPVIK